MRKLTFAENKLLKNTDFFHWDVSNNVQEAKILRRFKIERREDYVTYNKIARKVRDFARKIKDLDPEMPFRIEFSAKLIEEMYSLGVIPMKTSLELVDKITASSFCRRRLPCIMVHNDMVDNLKLAVTLVQHGHVRVGMDVIKDPAFLVTR